MQGLIKISPCIFVIEAIGAILSGLVMIFSGEYLILYGLLTIVLGPIAAWVGSWLLYALGELVEDVHAIRHKVTPDPVITTAVPSPAPAYAAKRSAPTSPPANGWTCVCEKNMQPMRCLAFVVLQSKKQKLQRNNEK